jgi:hypothetical protein
VPEQVRRHERLGCEAPEGARAGEYAAEAQFRNGDLDSAVKNLALVVERVPWWTLAIGWLAAISHIAGDRTRAEALGRSLPPGRDAATYRAVAATSTRCSRGSKSPGGSATPSCPGITREVVFEPYVGDLRLKRLLARMNLAI